MKNLLMFFLLGIILGSIYGILKSLMRPFKNNIIIEIITDLVFCLALGATLIYGFNYYNMGIIRLYLIVDILLGYTLERKTIGKLFAKLYLMLYNLLTKWISTFKLTKLGKIIFK